MQWLKSENEDLYLTNYPTILGSDGKPAFVVLPYADFVLSDLRIFYECY
jgi:hypothetical protein